MALVVNADLSEFADVRAYARGDELWTFGPEDMESIYEDGRTIIRIALTQEQTLLMSRCAYFQVRAVDADGTAVSTPIVSAQVVGTLSQEVLNA